MAAAIAIAALLAAAQPSAAVASGGHLSLRPGQTVTVRLDEAGPTVVDAAALKADGPRYNGEAVSFTLAPFNDGLMLSVHNGYGRRLVYDAEMYLASGAHDHTSTCPVMAHISGMEMWNDPIDHLDLSHLRLSDDAEMSCR